MKPVIRPELPFDIPAIHALTEAAFQNVPHSDHSEAFIVAALRDAGALSVSLVAEWAGAVVGHVAASPVSISDGSQGWYGLGPISVEPDLQGQGIGSLLMRSVLKQLEVQSAAGCVLLGEPAFYSRFGFKPEPDLILPEVPAEYFQALSFDSCMPHGVVQYHEAFSVRS